MKGRAAFNLHPYGVRMKRKEWMITKCKKCKTELPANAKFCHSCGTDQKGGKPRQKNGAGTYYERDDGTWQFRVSVGLQGDGRSTRKAFYGKTKKECREKYDQWMKEGDRRVYKSATVAEWADQWLELYKKGTVSYGTYNNYRMYIKNHIKPKLGKFRASQVKEIHIRQFYNTIAGKSKTMQNDIYVALNGIFSSAVKNHLCAENPVIKPVIPKKTKTQISVFSAEEVKKIVESDLPYSELPKLLLYTGLRVGEAVALKWSQYDPDAGILNVQNASARKEGGGWEDGDTKGRKDRTIYLTQEGKKLMSSLPRRGFYILANEDGQQLTPRMFEGRYHKFFAAADVEYKSPHKCRHTYATHLVKGGAELMAVQSLLGHTSIKVTEIYTHVLDDDKFLKDNIVKLDYGT